MWRYKYTKIYLIVNISTFISHIFIDKYSFKIIISPHIKLLYENNSPQNEEV